MTPEFRAYPVEGLDGVYVVPSRSQPGVFWSPTISVRGSTVTRTCQCLAAANRWCAHADRVAEVLEAAGLVEAFAGRWVVPLPSEDGDEAVVVELLAGRKRMAAGVR